MEPFAIFSRRFSSEKSPTITVANFFLVGAFLGKSARLLQWLVFFRQTTISL